MPPESAPQPPSFVQPYLFFGGRCDEALAFYQSALGAQVEFLMRYKESPEPIPPDRLAPGYEEKVMHSTFRIGQTALMASDGCGETANFSGFTLSLTVATPEAAAQAFNALADGGQVKMPLTRTFWSKCFGMVADRFGIDWMISVPA